MRGGVRTRLSPPARRRVAFVAGKFPANAIYVMNADGTNVRKLTP